MVGQFRRLPQRHEIHRTRIGKTLQSLDESGIVLERINSDQVEAVAAELYGLYHQVHDRKKLRLATIGEK